MCSPILMTDFFQVISSDEEMEEDKNPRKRAPGVLSRTPPPKKARTESACGLCGENFPSTVAKDLHEILCTHDLVNSPHKIYTAGERVWPLTPSWIFSDFLHPSIGAENVTTT